MIRRFTYLRRAPGQDLAAFRAYWAGRPISGAAGEAGFLAVAAAMTQNWAAPEVPGLIPEPRWDLVEEVVIRPEAAGEIALRDNPLHRLDAAADHADGAMMVQYCAAPKVVLDGPARGLRIFSLPRRKGGLSHDQFRRHYREVHGALVAKNAAFTRYANRYVQHHVLPGTIKATGGFVPYDGLSEFWFDSLDAAQSAWSDPSYMAELRADERNFVGNPPSDRLLVEPVEVALA